VTRQEIYLLEAVLVKEVLEALAGGHTIALAVASDGGLTATLVRLRLAISQILNSLGH
jgi:hypothetical protein